MIEIRNLTKKYGKKLALDHMSLDIPKGTFGLLGKNGAGKTTLMKTLTTLQEPTSGTCLIDGVSVKEKKKVRPMIGYIPQEFALYPNFTCYEILDYFMLLDGRKDTEDRIKRILEVLELVNLEEQAHVKFKNLSGGMKRRLGIAQAILTDPSVIVADEPTVGLDLEERRNIKELFKELAKERIVLISTHIISDVEDCCDRLGVMKEGKLVFQGTIDQLKAQTNREHVSLEEAVKELL